MISGIGKKYWRLPIVALCQVLILHPAFAQQGLRIVVIQGDAARNVVQQIPAKQLTVRIEDSNNRPVAGAVVEFTAPEGGPSGEFANDSRIVRVMSGPDGVAVAGVYHPNALMGPYQIRVTAQSNGESASAFILQTNIAEKQGHGKLIAIIAIAGGAAAAAVAYHGKSSSSGSSAPTITFGGAAVGAPK